MISINHHFISNHQTNWATTSKLRAKDMLRQREVLGRHVGDTAGGNWRGSEFTGESMVKSWLNYG